MAFCRRKRFTGISLIILGVTTIIFGVILAPAIPHLVMNALQKRVCIASEDNPNYQEWVGLFVVTKLNMEALKKIISLFLLILIICSNQ